MKYGLVFAAASVWFAGCGTEGADPHGTPGNLTLVQSWSAIRSPDVLEFQSPVRANDLVVAIDANAMPHYFLASGGQTTFNGAVIAWEFTGFAGEPVVDDMDSFGTTHQLPDFEVGHVTTSVDNELAITIATTTTTGRVGGAASPFDTLPGTNTMSAAQAIIPTAGTRVEPLWGKAGDIETNYGGSVFTLVPKP